MRYRIPSFGQLRLLLSVVVYLQGCSGSSGPPEFLDELVPVTGVVEVDGEPVAGVEVTFVPRTAMGGMTNNAKVQLATAVTDESGAFTLVTPRGGETAEKDREQLHGAVPGKYSATFHMWVLPDGLPWTAEPGASGGPVTVGATDKLPPKLGNPQTTPHQVDVKEGEDNAFEFKLTTK